MRPISTLSPGWIDFSFDVSGPLGTLMLKNSSCSSQFALAIEYARSSGLDDPSACSTCSPIITNWPFSKRNPSSRVVVKLK
ncbi:hypothetical protein D3C71_2086360 [compost metagenome]